MKNFEQQVHDELYRLLLSQNHIDEHLPEAPDIEGHWERIGLSYLEDGVREFKEYPTASLGWMMYIGMAVAKLWDEDWTLYGAIDDLYRHLRDKSGFDLMDEYIRGPILGLKSPQFEETEQLVQTCAEQSHTLLMHASFEPGTEPAFRGYLACLHQLYQMGAAVQLKRMGYHMVGIKC